MGTGVWGHSGHWAMGIVAPHLGLIRVPSLLNSEALPWLYLYSIAPRCIAKMHRVRVRVRVRVKVRIRVRVRVWVHVRVDVRVGVGVWVGPGLGLAPQQRHLHREDALRRSRLL